MLIMGIVLRTFYHAIFTKSSQSNNFLRFNCQLRLQYSGYFMLNSKTSKQKLHVLFGSPCTLHHIWNVFSVILIRDIHNPLKCDAKCKYLSFSVVPMRI